MKGYNPPSTLVSVVVFYLNVTSLIDTESISRVTPFLSMIFNFSTVPPFNKPDSLIFAPVFTLDKSIVKSLIVFPSRLNTVPSGISSLIVYAFSTTPPLASLIAVLKLSKIELLFPSYTT